MTSLADDNGATWAWAREYAERAPRWSDQQWRQANAILGLRVKAKLAHRPDSKSERRTN
jgi:hypothetical protein